MAFFSLYGVVYYALRDIYIFKGKCFALINGNQSYTELTGNHHNTKSKRQAQR